MRFPLTPIMLFAGLFAVYSEFLKINEKTQLNHSSIYMISVAVQRISEILSLDLIPL